MRLIKLSEIFDRKMGTDLELCRLEKVDVLEESSINFVSRTSKNNGVSATVKRIEGITPSPSHSISVPCGGSVLETFYQSKPFYSGRDLYCLIPKIELSPREMMFYAYIIRQNKYKYNYGRQANRTFMSLLVPSKEEIPSWVYTMEINDYSDIAEPKAVEKVSLPPVNEWKSFEYEELFTIVKAKGPTATHVKKNPGSIPYVTASMENNGITGYGDFTPSHNGNCLTVGHLGDVFYQPNDFSGNNVTVCVPTFEGMNVQIGLFLSSLMNKNKFKYNYGRVVGIARLKAEKISVPVNKEGVIDTELITKYMNSLSYSKYL